MKRIQRKRTKGWKMPENAIYVGRPTKWGNPFKLSPSGFVMLLDPRDGKWNKWSVTRNHDLQTIVNIYETWINGTIIFPEWMKPPDISELKGKDLACWCPIIHKNKYVPCHADILLSLANDIPIKNIIDENIQIEKILQVL